MFGSVAYFFKAALHTAAVCYIGGGNGGHADNSVHWSTDLMAHSGKKILFGSIGILGIYQGIV